MDVLNKLRVLSMSAKYDVACTSSGSDRGSVKGMLGNTKPAGICHSFTPDGRCVSLLKVLFSNSCIYNCEYCVNRRDNDVERATFTPEELGELTINFYKRNYIEGLFLSSAVIKNPDYTMELLYSTLKIVREKYKFNGYIHVKAIPGASQDLIQKTGLLADRMSVNIELPSSESLQILAPEKSKTAILKPMRMIKNNIVQNKEELILYKHAPKFAPAGQSTQLIVGATPESDKKIITLSENLYNRFGLKRVFYSAYQPVSNSKILPTEKPPLLREHRLYQADWLLRYYGFTSEDILKEDENLSLNMDPKCQWALNNLHLFPVEINSADYFTLLKVPGIGVLGVDKIVKARKNNLIDFEDLKKMRIVLKRAKYFITCKGKMFDKFAYTRENLDFRLSENKINEQYEQLSFFDGVQNT